jgi:hypothetical protein
VNVGKEKDGKSGMRSETKIVTLRRPEEGLSTDLRDFLDSVIVPALLEKYLAESVVENNRLHPIWQTSHTRRVQVSTSAIGGEHE